MGFFSFFKNFFKESKELIKTEHPVQIKFEQKQVKVLPQKMEMVDIDGYESISGGYLNYATFKVTGKNPSTKRKNSKQIEARDEASTIKIAKNSNLVEPFTIEVITNKLPSEKQISYAKALGGIFPDDVCASDISCIICRLESEEVDLPDQGLVRWALDEKVHFSRFVNTSLLTGAMLRQLEDSKKWQFYCYLIYCDIIDAEITDGRKASYWGNILKCSEMVKERPDIQKSLLENNPYNHYTKGYKSIKQWFTTKNVI